MGSLYSGTQGPPSSGVTGDAGGPRTTATQALQMSSFEVMLYYAIVGLVAGVLAKWIMPGERHEPQGCLMTMVLGIGGAMLAGFLLGSVLQVPGMVGIVGATLGAIGILWLMRKYRD